MQRVCFILQIRPDRLSEYRERHQAVWPEMLDALKECGWKNYSLFLHPEGQVIGYLETEDFEKARECMAMLPINLKWQREMAPFFYAPPGVTPDQIMKPLPELFHID
jgi:L-rhamnose mutarotase